MSNIAMDALSHLHYGSWMAALRWFVIFGLARVPLVFDDICAC
jgi:hypothetical protein